MHTAKYIPILIALLASSPLALAAPTDPDAPQMAARTTGASPSSPATPASEHSAGDSQFLAPPKVNTDNKGPNSIGAGDKNKLHSGGFDVGSEGPKTGGSGRSTSAGPPIALAEESTTAYTPAAHERTQYEEAMGSSKQPKQ